MITQWYSAKEMLLATSYSYSSTQRLSQHITEIKMEVHKRPCPCLSLRLLGCSRLCTVGSCQLLNANSDRV